MKLNNLKLNNFRNYAELNMVFKKDINCFTGLNGQGKTNIIEAVSLLGLLSSFRTSNFKEMKKFNEDYFFISGIFKDKNENDLEVKISYSNEVKKVVFQDKKISRYSEFWGKIPIVYLIPDESVTTTGPPSERRRFTDKLLSMIDSEYFSLIKNYSKIIKQKNQILINLKTGKTTDKSMISIYNKQLIDYGQRIFDKRIKFIDDFIGYFKDILIFISDGLYNGNIEYYTICEKQNFGISLADKLEKGIQKEIERGLSLYGPHKDDLLFTINGNDLRKYGSKGQHKLFLVALKLAEIKYIKSITDEYPVFLLDDLYSEIDEKKTGKIAEILDKDIQTFITTSSSSIINQFDSNNTSIFNVSNGVCRIK